MKNLFMAFSCMSEQLKVAVYDNLNKWHLQWLIWSLNLNLGFKPTSFKLLLVALAQIIAYWHVMIMHHIVAFHWLCSFLFAGGCSFSVEDDSDIVIIDTYEEHYYLQKCQASNPPRSLWYNPTLSLLLSFTALGQQRINCYMLR